MRFREVLPVPVPHRSWRIFYRDGPAFRWAGDEIFGGAGRDKESGDGYEMVPGVSPAGFAYAGKRFQKSGNIRIRAGFLL